MANFSFLALIIWLLTNKKIAWNSLDVTVQIYFTSIVLMIRNRMHLLSRISFRHETPRNKIFVIVKKPVDRQTILRNSSLVGLSSSLLLHVQSNLLT
jgi:hypothetical protein